MTRWRLLVLAILAGVGSLLYFQVARHGAPVQDVAAHSSEITAAGNSETPRARTVANTQTSSLGGAAEQPAASDATTGTVPSVPRAPALAPPVPETAESSSMAPATILQNMRTSIRQYGSMFGGNPVGNNLEITSALQGDNPKQINFLKQDGNRVNANGELVDAWGTPYFFHQLSAEEMEVRSAGPDRVMYTGDDLVTR
jgi:hypothetical protein